MSERQQIEVKVRHLATRKRFQLMLEGALRGLFWGALAACLVLFASKLWILPVGGLALGALTGEQTLAIGLMAVALLGGAGWGLLRKVTLIKVANDVDVRLGLRERVSSALALDPQRDKQPFVKALVTDAAQTMKDLPLKSVYPWQLPRTWVRCAVAVLAAAGLSFVPQLNWFTKSSDRAEAQLVQDSGKKVLELAKEVEKEAVKQRDPEMKAIAKEIKRVGEKLNNQQLKKKDALKELERLKDKLETQARNQSEKGQKAFTADLAEEMKKFKSTRELGDMLDKEGMRSMMSQMNKLMQDLAQGKMSEQQMQQLKDMSQALKEALGKQEQNEQTKAMQEQLEQLDEALKQAQEAREQLQKSLDNFQQDLKSLTDSMQQNGMGQQAQQLQQQMQQLQQQMQQSGQLSQQSLQQMSQQLEQTQQQIQQQQQSGQLSQQQAQQMSGQCKQCQGQLGQSGQVGQANQGAQQGNQQLGQQMGQMAQGMGQQAGQGQGNASQAQLLAQQIAQMKQQLGYGQPGTQGTAQSGWGRGTSPYAVAPAPAKGQNQVENRQEEGVSHEGMEPTHFESLYEGQDVGHAFSEEGQLRGKLDLRHAPQKIDEVRSAPETQEALAGYADIIGSYSEGEENAIQQEQVPQEYRELVKQYFDQLQKESKKKSE